MSENNQERIRIRNYAAEAWEEFYYHNGGCTKEEYDQTKAEAEREATT